MANRQHPTIAVLLTGTIDPAATPFVVRRDVEQRQRDYRAALVRWLDVPDIAVVFCENSGSDLGFLREAVGAARTDVPVELLSFAGNTAAQTKGKGAGEHRIIEYALANSATLTSVDYIVKLTGRLRIDNQRQFIDAVRSAEPVRAMIDIRFAQRMSMADSKVLVASPRFLRDYLFPLGADIDDHAGVYFEHVLARAVHACAAHGERWSILPACARISGVSASTGRAYHGNPLARGFQALAWRMRRRALR